MFSGALDFLPSSLEYPLLLDSVLDQLRVVEHVNSGSNHQDQQVRPVKPSSDLLPSWASSCIRPEATYKRPLRFSYIRLLKITLPAQHKIRYDWWKGSG